MSGETGRNENKIKMIERSLECSHVHPVTKYQSDSDRRHREGRNF